MGCQLALVSQSPMRVRALPLRKMTAWMGQLGHALAFVEYGVLPHVRLLP